MEHTWDLIKVLLALLAILSLFYMIAKLLKEKKIFNQSNQIKVIERNYLNSNQVIYLLQVVDEIWLVTATKDNIEFIKKLDISLEEIEESSPQGANILNFFKKGTDSRHEE